MFGAAVSLEERRRLRKRAVSEIDGNFKEKTKTNNPVIHTYLLNVLSNAKNQAEIRGVKLLTSFIAALEPPQIPPEVAQEVNLQELTPAHFEWEIRKLERQFSSKSMSWVYISQRMIVVGCNAAFRDTMRLHALRIKRMISRAAV